MYINRAYFELFGAPGLLGLYHRLLRYRFYTTPISRSRLHSFFGHVEATESHHGNYSRSLARVSDDHIFFLFFFFFFFLFLFFLRLLLLLCIVVLASSVCSGHLYDDDTGPSLFYPMELLDEPGSFLYTV